MLYVVDDDDNDDDDNEHLYTHTYEKCRWIEKFVFMNNSEHLSKSTENCYTFFLSLVALVRGKQSID